MKVCTDCGKAKRRGNFYAHPTAKDRLTGRCKECFGAWMRIHRLKNIERYREYNRTRDHTANRRRQRMRYPGKAKARDAVSNAIQDKRLVRALCEVCGNKRSEAHHDDYRRKLVVRWLCVKHHHEYHQIHH